MSVAIVVGNQTNGFSGDHGLATRAQLDTPDGVAIAPDGDLIVADSRNDRIRRVDQPTRIITTIAGSGKNGYDGDDKLATEAALNNPDAVATAPNGDIYIADTLNNRIRVVDHATGFIHTVAGDGQVAGPDGSVGDGGPATSAHLFMPSDVQIATNGDLYIADMQHNRIRKVDAKTQVITTVAGNGVFGAGGDNGPATEASLANPAGVALVEDSLGRVTIFIADYYNGAVRTVGPDGVMRHVNEEGVKFGAPTRVAFAPGTEWLYVADASTNLVVALNIPTTTLGSRPVVRNLQSPRNPGRKIG